MGNISTEERQQNSDVRIEKNLYLFGISLHFFSVYLNIFSPGTLADPDPQAWLFCMLTKVYFSQQDVPLRSSVVLGDHQQHQWVSTPDSGEYF